ncbi:hypothetical protein [Streptomyces pinistramenti]|uniref:hypothetical protein n=1 Tax=Streptomyces pinistramenti TaxID=2884812 RepID=UPI001D05E205|nr:hypothetical protein [Streptomyces pinistramenti]MCB5911490.1 hypothetical protein [Streptomyces pinistramenti]
MSILDMILSGPHRAEELAARLGSFGIDPDGPLAVLAVVPDTPAAASTLAALPAAITECLVQQGVPSVVAGSGQDVVTVVGLYSADTEPSGLADGLFTCLRQTVRGQRVVIGVGQVAGGHQVLRRSLLQAGMSTGWRSVAGKGIRRCRSPTRVRTGCCSRCWTARPAASSRIPSSARSRSTTGRTTAT